MVTMTLHCPHHHVGASCDHVDKHAAHPKVMADLKATGLLAESVDLRQVNYLNTLIEQDHRVIKWVIKPGMGFFSFETAGRRLQG
jgi:IS6 family transposase